jgi:anti-anti-sigma factor
MKCRSNEIMGQDLIATTWLARSLEAVQSTSAGGFDEAQLRIQTEVSGDVFILRCEGRIVLGDEAAVLRERVKSLLSGTPKVVINVDGVEYIDSGGIGVLVGLFVSAATRGGEVKLVWPTKHMGIRTL